MFDAESIDLIVTSPPYYGVADYIKSQRLSYLWFDRDDLEDRRLGYEFFEAYRRRESGARSFRHRSNSREAYLDFMAQFFLEAFRLLKREAFLSLVVGESKARGETTEALIDSARSSGFALDVKEARNIKETRRRLMAKVKDEHVLVFKKS